MCVAWPACCPRKTLKKQAARAPSQRVSTLFEVETEPLTPLPDTHANLHRVAQTGLVDTGLRAMGLSLADLAAIRHFVADGEVKVPVDP
jgi:hypothetical protein